MSHASPKMGRQTTCLILKNLENYAGVMWVKLMEKIWHGIIKWINETIDLCPLESVRKQRREASSDAKFVVIFLPDEGSPSNSHAMERQSTDGLWQTSSANVRPFVVLFLQTVSDRTWWFAWLRSRSDFCCLDVLWSLRWAQEQWQAKAVWEFVGILGSKGRSAECSVSGAWALCTLQHGPSDPSHLGDSSSHCTSLEKCHHRGN